MNSLAASVEYSLSTRDGVRLYLARYPSARRATPVLLLHGAAQGADSFTVGGRVSLIAHLSSRGFDVWALDWRGGKRIVADSHDLTRDRGRFALDEAARHDVVAALAAIRAEVGFSGPLAVVGQCMGGGVLAMAIGGGFVPSELGLTHVVLLTLGLFYRLGAPSWLKVQDHIVEQIALGDRAICLVDSTKPRSWPDPLARAYARWPRALLPRCDNHICHGLNFLFGGLFRAENLEPALHEEGFLREHFGEIPLMTFLHATQNARRGFAGPLDAPAYPTTYLDASSFAGLRITLITGDENRMWHRSSIDLMYDWLRRSHSHAHVQKHVLPGYGHLDLLWGRRAPQDVFSLIETGLTN